MNPVRTTLATALAAAALSMAMPASAQQNYSQTIFFGDSLTDAGSFRPALIQAVGPSAAVLGRFTTNPGLVWSEHVASSLGTNASPANQGGTNYAVGGARTGTNGVSPFGAIPSLTSQINTHLAANGGRADANALYSVWGGANDIFAAAAVPAQAQAILGAAVTSQVGNVATLQNAGARYILVPTVPDIGITPDFRRQGAAGMAAGTQLSTTYNTALFSGLSSAGLRVIPVDTFNLLREIVNNPAPFGFRNVTDPGCRTQPAPAGSSSLFCNPLSYVAPDVPDAFVFADGVHPSSKAHAILADYALSLLEAPRQLAMLTHSADTVGRARADRVSAQIEQRDEAEGTRWWADMRLDSQRYGDGDVYDGMGPTLTFGVDWASGALVFGGFAGYGEQKLDWGRRGGEFDQSDATLGGYLGWSSGSFWANGQVSYTWLSYDVDRQVQLGDVTRVHTGSPDGENLGIAASAGWDFGSDSFRHGPVVSLVSQTIDIDGYDENSTEATALSFPDQEYDSLIGSVGWQMHAAVGENLHPYARLTYDHQFEEEAEEAFAQLRSMPGLAPYAVPGVEFDRDYGTLTFGARTEMFGLGADIGTSLTMGQKGGNDATVFVSLNGTF